MSQKIKTLFSRTLPTHSPSCLYEVCCNVSIGPSSFSPIHIPRFPCSVYKGLLTTSARDLRIMKTFFLNQNPDATVFMRDVSVLQFGFVTITLCCIIKDKYFFLTHFICPCFYLGIEVSLSKQCMFSYTTFADCILFLTFFVLLSFSPLIVQEVHILHLFLMWHL